MKNLKVRSKLPFSLKTNEGFSIRNEIVGRPLELEAYAIWSQPFQINVRAYCLGRGFGIFSLQFMKLQGPGQLGFGFPWRCVTLLCGMSKNKSRNAYFHIKKQLASITTFQRHSSLHLLKLAQELRQPHLKSDLLFLCMCVFVCGCTWVLVSKDTPGASWSYRWLQAT